MEIRDQGEVRDFEDWRVRIGVDRDDVASFGDAGEMVTRAADPAGEIECGSDRLAGLPHLALAIDPAEIDCDATRSNTRLQRSRDTREPLKTVGAADPAATRNDAVRIANVDLSGIRRDFALDANRFFADLQRVDALDRSLAIGIRRHRFGNAGFEGQHRALVGAECRLSGVPTTRAERCHHEATVAIEAGLKRRRYQPETAAEREARRPLATVGTTGCEYDARPKGCENGVGVRSAGPWTEP